jgi:hypothetical protein
MKKFSLLALLALVFATGCVRHRITNLTASQQPRNPNRQYLIEYEWDSNQQSIRPVSVRPFVIVGFDAYEMRPVLRMTNRWETLITVPAEQTSVNYHFKVDYEYNDFRKRGKASTISPEYRLKVSEN